MSGGEAIGRSDLERLIHGFLATRAGRRNPRSLTAVREVDGRRYHLKRSERPVADEVAGLDLAARAGAVDRVRAIELVASDVRRNVVMTRWVDGESLFNVAWNRARSPRPWEDTAARLGRWLGAFHRVGAESATPGESRRERLRWLRRSFRTRLDLLGREKPPLLGSRQAAAILELAREGLVEEGWRDQPVTRIHGDFTLANHLLGRDGVLYVLDFGDSTVGFALEDVARLWTALWEIGRCGRRRDRELRAALPSFLGACGLDASVTRSRCFRVLRAWNAVNQLSVARAARRRYGVSTHRIHRRLVGAELAWIEAGLPAG